MKKPPHIIVIKPGRGIRTLYTDVVDLGAIGVLNVHRASNVEYDAERKGWLVQLTTGDWLSWYAGTWTSTPAKGNAVAFTKRTDGLNAEIEYLQTLMVEGDGKIDEMLVSGSAA